MNTMNNPYTLVFGQPPIEITKIREILGYSSNQFNPYRDLLLKVGILVSPRNGILKFTLPWFDEYAIERTKLEEN